MQTAYDLVWMAAERTPDQLAIVDDLTSRRLTYRELIREIDIIAAGLHERGVRAGHRIATVLPNYFEHCLVLLALQRLAAVPALMNFRLHPEQSAEMMRQASVRGAIIRNEEGLAATLAAAVPDGGFLLSVGGAAAPAEHFGACRGDTAVLPPRPRPARDDLSFIFYTSGTTGKPKAAMVSHGANEHRIIYMSPMFGVRQGEHLRALGISPLFHAIGFYGLFLTTLAFNGTYYVMSAFSPAEALTSIEKNRISFLFVVPTVLQAIVSAPDYRPERLSSVELVLFGGAAMPAALLQRIDSEWRATLIHAYGSTEAMTPLFMPDPVSCPRTLRPGYSARVRVVRLGGGPQEMVAPGEAGELIVDADRDSLFSGYLDQPDETAKKVRGGWYFTGDTCIWHGNGELDLVGRVDDMIRSGGESIYPEEVEAVLLSHPAVKEACVVGIPHELWGEAVTACIVLNDTAVDQRELENHCTASMLAKYKRPRAYVFTDALPRNASNKILRRVLREEVVAKSSADTIKNLITAA